MTKHSNENVTDNEIYINEGKEIYVKLKEKYPNPNMRDLGIIADSLFYALIVYMNNHIPDSHYEGFMIHLNSVLLDNYKPEHK